MADEREIMKARREGLRQGKIADLLKRNDGRQRQAGKMAIGKFMAEWGKELAKLREKRKSPSEKIVPKSDSHRSPEELAQKIVNAIDKIPPKEREKFISNWRAEIAKRLRERKR